MEFLFAIICFNFQEKAKNLAQLCTTKNHRDKRMETSTKFTIFYLLADTYFQRVDDGTEQSSLFLIFYLFESNV